MKNRNLSLRSKPKLTEETGVYFVTDGEAVKIGFASNIRKRISDLQVSHHFPLFFLGGIKATRAEEQSIHRRFSHLRMRGEWFKKAAELFDFIDSYEDTDRWIPNEYFEIWERQILK